MGAPTPPRGRVRDASIGGRRGALPPGYLPPLTTGLPLSDGLYLPDGAPGAAAGAASAPPCVDARRPHRLRVGYVSSDFMNHPYAHLTRSIYGLHGTGCAVECFCYALTPGDGSQWRATIEAQAEHFRDISGMDTATAAATIAADGIHVLVNANGYTKGARSELFALRPAPVQVSFMGFAGTLAARSIDYALTDSVVTPPSMRAYTYAEALLLHPHSYFVCDHAQSAAMSAEAGRVPPGAAAATPPPVSRARYGLPQNTFLFCNFNQLYKIDAATFGSWARILRACPRAKLWLLRFPADAETRIRAAAAAHEVPADAIIFTDVCDKAEHIARCALGDLFLDTPVCNAHTTATDALWSGVPLLTLPGVSQASRVAASILTAAGVPELVAHSAAHYERMAVEFAQVPPPGVGSADGRSRSSAATSWHACGGASHGLAPPRCLTRRAGCATQRPCSGRRGSGTAAGCLRRALKGWTSASPIRLP
eukprot:TRINITY_DN2658_c0_g1_i3.p1 TRINITY_DN2658_c0_g1~~TRINITY_DN2658_c0_g1_i3.p1  ORF type:complete len:500 (-),score=113.61 TRINITY_DN2658_c0_g1_i3:113-1555(-)